MSGETNMSEGPAVARVGARVRRVDPGARGRPARGPNARQRAVAVARVGDRRPADRPVHKDTPRRASGRRAGAAHVRPESPAIASLLALLRRRLADGWAAPSPASMAVDLGVDRSTVYRHLRRLEAAGAIVRERRRVGSRLMTGWSLAGEADPLRVVEDLGAATPDTPAARVAAVRVLRYVGVDRLRRLLAPLAPAERRAVPWWTREGWRAARRAGAGAAPLTPPDQGAAQRLAAEILARPWWPRPEGAPCCS